MAATKWKRRKLTCGYYDYEMKSEFLPDGVHGVYLGFECTRRPRRNASVQPMYSVRFVGHKGVAYLGIVSKGSRAPCHNGRRVYSLRIAKQRGNKYGRWPWWLEKNGIVCSECDDCNRAREIDANA